MELMLWLIPSTLALTGLAALAFIWASHRGQFNNLDRHALNIFEKDIFEKDILEKDTLDEDIQKSGENDDHLR